jgi:hypothetical protein
MKAVLDFLLQDRIKWKALMNIVMNIRAPYKAWRLLNRRVTALFLRKEFSPWS